MTVAAALVPDRGRRRRDDVVRCLRQRQRADVDQDRGDTQHRGAAVGHRPGRAGQRVTAATVDQSLVLTGEVGTPDEATNVLQVAGQFVDDPTRVVNHMTVAAPTQVNLQVASPRSRATSTGSSASAGAHRATSATAGGSA